MVSKQEEKKKPEDAFRLEIEPKNEGISTSILKAVPVKAQSEKYSAAAVGRSKLTELADIAEKSLKNPQESELLATIRKYDRINPLA